MKKISLFAVALATGMFAFAQQPTLRTEMARKARFGVKAGVNIAKFAANDYASGYEPSVNNKTSMHAGFLANFPVGMGGFALQPELLYNGYGSKMEVSSGGMNPTMQHYEQDMHYISLPIMVQWKSTGGFYLETGPQASYLVKATNDGPGGDVDNKDQFDKFDIAWAGGIGYMSRIGLGVGARYNFGLSNVLEDGGGNNSANNGPELKNRVISIGLTWQFGAYK